LTLDPSNPLASLSKHHNSIPKSISRQGEATRRSDKEAAPETST
jgi:hypothetical protein